MARVALGALLCTTCLVTPWAVAGSAQSSAGPDHPPGRIVHTADSLSTGPAQMYGVFATAPLAVPANLRVSDAFLPLVQAMLRASPTFRRQCLRLAGARDLTVHLYNHAEHAAGPRARTRLTTSASGRREAVVQVIALRDHAELIAHEIEHIIEQLDGVDLDNRARRRAAGVRRCSRGAFETIRAIRAGHAVADEMRGARR